MSDRGSIETPSRRGPSTVLWVGALVLAAAATAVLVISDDARLLRLGLVAALWSALIGAFAVARLRHRVAEGEQFAAERQRVYELELEREIAARREFELEAQAEARRQAAEESEGELKALQAELRRLRESLEQVVGGNVLFERVALRAESTRVRSLPERHVSEGQLVEHSQVRELPAANAASNGVLRDTGTRSAFMSGEQKSVAHDASGVLRDTRTRSAFMSEEQKSVTHDASGVVRDTGTRSAFMGTEQKSVPHDASTELISRLTDEPPREERRPRPHPKPKSQPVQARRRPEPPRRTPEPQVSGVPQPEPAAPAEPDPAGAHAAGTSVNDLLAAYGNNTDKQRRRRRRA